MLTLYRRHRANCKSTARRAKCFCPIWVQGILRGENIRKSLDLTNWEAANKLVRDWEIEKPKNTPTIEEAATRFLADLASRGLSRDTVKKFELLTAELSERFPGWLVDRFTPDDMGKFREKWDLKPSTAAKKLERLRSFFKFCVDRKWCEHNPASALRPPKETAIEKKPYDNNELEKIAWAIPLFPSKGIYGEENRERIKAFVSVLRWTGLRIRDVVQLKRSAVDDKYITVRTHKNGKPVQLPVHPEMQDARGRVPVLVRRGKSEILRGRLATDAPEAWRDRRSPCPCSSLAAHVRHTTAIEGCSRFRGRGDFRKQSEDY